MQEQLDIADLCSRYGASVLRRCQGVLRDHNEAKDAAQEVFIIVMQKGHQYRGDADVAGWLYRITTNLCLNRLRSGKRRNVREQSEQVMNWSTVKVPDPYERFSAKGRLHDLLIKLDKLGQQILVYRYLDGFTQEEISTLIQKSRRTVCKRLKIIDQLISQAQESLP